MIARVLLSAFHVLALGLGLGAVTTIEGVITTPTGAPVEGARVAAVPVSPGGASQSAASAISREGGRFRIERLRAGSYALTATAPGLPAAYLREVDAKPGTTTRADLRFEAQGWTISGSIRDSHGVPLARALVTAGRISNDEGDLFEVIGDDRGRYAITLPKATYLLQPVVAGHVADSKPQVLGADTTLDFELQSLAELRGPAPAEVVAWSRQHAVALATTEAGRGLADMRPLQVIVGDARVVELGEATHGTKEFFQLKHRILEYLATEMGFEIFAIEASWPESLAVDEYVTKGVGDPEKALAGMYFWTWDTHEVLDMIRWMRRFNEDPRHEKKLRFYGFDMQFPMVAARKVVEYVRLVDPERADEAARDLAALSEPKATTTYPQLGKPDQEATASAVARWAERFAKERTAYVARSSERDFAVAEHHLRIVRQAEENLRSGAPDLRDRYMAENVRWLLDQDRGARMVLWAHNGHVSFGEPFSSKPMGAWLKEALGRDVVSLGFAFDQGSFQAMDLRNKRGLVTFTVPAAQPGSVESTLTRAGLSIAVLDLRSLPARGPVHDWWLARHFTRSIGAVYTAEAPEGYLVREAIPKSYDGIVFVRSTTAAVPNPSGVRPPPPR